MAEYLFRKICSERNINAECRSAGIATFTGAPASDNSVEVMKEIGIDLSNFRSSRINALNLDEFDLFVPMTYSHALGLLTMGVEKKKIYLFDKDVTDPYGGDIGVYRETRDEIAENLVKLADFIKNNY